MSNALSLGMQQTFRAMGVACRVTVVASQPFTMIDSAIERVHHLEQLWSRFLSTSELSRLNRSSGMPVRVSSETVQLIAHMQAAVSATKGYFNPTLLPLQVSAGDNRSLSNDTKPVPLNESAVAGPASRIHDISITDDNLVTLPHGLALDAGGIGKGLAADIVAEHVLSMGADSVAINLGGDVRICAREHSTLDWPITIASPTPDSPAISTLSLRRGAVATSAQNARHRTDAGIPRHIFATPTEKSSDGALALGETPIGATVVASTAAWAEAWTKHAVLAPINETIARIDDLGLAALLVLPDGSTVTSQTWQDFTP